jgi:hypothetical protein
VVGTAVSTNPADGCVLLGNRVGVPGVTLGLSVTVDALGDKVVGIAVPTLLADGCVVLGN